MDKVFFLSSGAGDAIYSLPTVRDLGGGTFVYGGTKELYLALKPLLEAQPYIKECKHISETELPIGFINLELFRTSPLGNKAHLVNLFRDAFKLPFYDFEKQGGWLNIDHSIDNIVVVNVTPRYRDKIFDKTKGWKRQINTLNKFYKGRVLFLGDIKDYAKFIEHNNLLTFTSEREITYIETKDFLQAAKIIAGSEIFFGTQSSLLAIRQGLGLSYRFEQSPNHVDVNQYSSRETVINPKTRRLHLLIVSIKKIITGKQ